jgi:hypothetical protein
VRLVVYALTQSLPGSTFYKPAEAADASNSF